MGNAKEGDRGPRHRVKGGRGVCCGTHGLGREQFNSPMYLVVTARTINSHYWDIPCRFGRLIEAMHKIYSMSCPLTMRRILPTVANIPCPPRLRRRAVTSRQGYNYGLYIVARFASVDLEIAKSIFRWPEWSSILVVEHQTKQAARPTFSILTTLQSDQAVGDLLTSLSSRLQGEGTTRAGCLSSF